MTPTERANLHRLVYRTLIFFGFVDLLSPTLPFIADLQKTHALLPLMRFFSILGTESFFLALLPLIYWGVSRPLGLRLGALLLFSVIVNEIFKVGFAQPRPYWFDAGLKLSEENSFGFPSGHAQNAFLIWLFLALHSSNKKVWVPLAVVLALCISFSRIYLGVHYPTDVLGGAVIGLSILTLYKLCGPAWMRFWRQLSTAQRITFAVFSTAFLGGIYAIAMVMGTNGYPTDYGSPSLPAIQNSTSGVVIAPRLGAFMGLIIGAVLTSRHLTFEARAKLSILVPRFVVGFVGLIVFYVGAKKIFPDGVIWHFLRYALVSWWIVFGAVWVFGKLKINGGQRMSLFPRSF